MQQNCVANLACLPGMDLASLFLPQNNDPPMYEYDFSAFDMADLDPYPYSYNGSVTTNTTTVSSVSAGGAAAAAEDQRQETMGRGNDERKRRRLASNRESARRSRVRKQRRLGELSLQVAELLGTNQRLLVQLNHVVARHAALARENARLRDEAAGLQRRLDELEALALGEADGEGEAEGEAEEAAAGSGTPEVA